MHHFLKVRKPGLLLGAIAAMGVLFGAAGPSRAQIMLTAPPTVSPVAGGLYEWDYFPVLSAGHSLAYGDFFTVYDFDGFIAKSQTRPNFAWSMTTNATGAKWGPTPAGFSASGIDNPNITNLSWQWILQGLPAGSSNLSLGKFSALSTYGGIMGGNYSQKSHAGGGTLSSGFGHTYVPDKNGSYIAPGGDGGVSVDGIGGGGPVNVTPEPNSMVLMLGGASVFPVLSLMRRRRAMSAKRS